MTIYKIEILRSLLLADATVIIPTSEDVKGRATLTESHTDLGVVPPADYSVFVNALIRQTGSLRTDEIKKKGKKRHVCVKVYCDCAVAWWCEALSKRETPHSSAHSIILVSCLPRRSQHAGINKTNTHINK